MTKQSDNKTPRKRVAKRGVANDAATSKDGGLHVSEALKGEHDDPLNREEAIRTTCGILLLALAAFTLLSLASHLVTGGEDQKVLQGGYIGSAKNWAGYVGAWWSNYWITENFGFGAFFIPVFLFAASLKLTGAYHVRLWKWLINCGFLLCWVSVASAFFLNGMFSESHLVPGGNHGLYVVGILEDVGGPVGTFIIILLTLLAYLCYLSAETIRILRQLMHPKQLARDMRDHYPVLAWVADKLNALRRWMRKPQPATDEAEEEAEVSEAERQQPDDEATILEAEESGEALTLTLMTDKETDEEGIPFAQVAGEGPAEAAEATNAPSTSQQQGEDATWVVAAQGAEATEFTIEQPVEEEIADETREKALEPYDPKLDLENYHYPTLDLLKHYDIDPRATIDMEEQNKNKDQIVNVLHNFGVSISSIKATVGPTITLYEITPAPGVRISKIRNLEDDIALSLAALGIRIIAPIPGKGTIGIEVPNAKPQIVSMESIINSRKFQESTMELPMALGKTITNEVFMADLAKMPHLLVAGATGQGKSVGLNAIITSLLYKKHPAELKLVMVDPKKVEFSIYSPIINHFLAHVEDEYDEPIITDVQKVINTLKSLCVEMDTRYDLLKKARARNIKEYNEKFRNRQLNPENGHKFMPYIVVIIDEFGDLIMTAGKDIELPIARIAQLARAVGIHMIIATQRPTTNIITGTIKANFPARMAFKVSAMIDSRTILDRPGANQLVGKGDMLFLAGNEPVRIQCAFVDTPEVERICSHIACQQSYQGPFDLPRPPMEDGGSGVNDVDMDHLDPMFAEAAKLIVSTQQGSTSMIQRKFSIGYNRAGRLMDQLEKAGIVGQAQGSKPREVLVQDEMQLEMLLNNLG